ncbi:hypothetical protein [Vibrio gazogenes]|uniref:Lipoprotein n=1 Tax=Vibrio gazogenes DSM 21264 = NBRC 103151 TaxID=1123492 RepID=A0A1M5G0U4_VIBGA|nr:hypothetical protein [Vibrio gazogenes]USP14727.1 hypothetical protein MKS89_05285 [Vibrio gazogenes]SHF97339.1 hypothetical protein SAMN02745781_03656 [Vibrio gazogenes DSM 21264] [Vibrio gazogenes DSM 21264 = NBRC 103151]
MNKISLTKKVVLLGVALASATLSGCTVTRMSAMQRHFHETNSLKDDYPSRSFSDAQQFIYSVERVQPTGVNDLDSFNAFEFVDSDHLVANAVGASLAIPVSPWLALNNLIVSQNRKGTPLLRESVLILMEPIKSNSNSPKEQLDADIEQTVDKLTLRAEKIVKDAYSRAGTPVALEEIDTNGRSGYASWYSPKFLVPNGVEYCPQNINSVSELSDSQIKYCTTILTNRGFVNFVNPENQYSVPIAINDNYAYTLMRLPDGFPVESLKTESEYSFLFMPSFVYHKSNIADGLNSEMVIKLADEGRLSMNPLVKNINTGEYMYFNSDVSKYQKNKYERIDDEAVYMQTH